MIYVGLDDTDVIDAPGTNQLAKALAEQLQTHYDCPFVLRHQLLEDARIPFTRHNSAAALCLTPKSSARTFPLLDRIRSFVCENAAPGADPGICLAKNVPDAVRRVGRRCQREIVDQNAARRLAEATGLLLEGLAGTRDGMIGCAGRRRVGGFWSRRTNRDAQRTR